MSRSLLLSIILCFTALCSFAQKEGEKLSLTKEQTADLIKRTLSIDTAKVFRDFSQEACKCIDSIETDNKSMKEIAAAISDCIDKQVMAYQLTVKIYQSMTNPMAGNKIILNSDKESDEYKQHYYNMERWLTDSCGSIKLKIATSDIVKNNSYSDNKEANAQYNEGIDLLKTDQYEPALKKFNKAVEIDPGFVFAWDNVGICNRRLGKYDEAIVAYKKSLELDPKGITPLHNLPVAYELKKDFDNALKAYQQIAIVYPEDPEALYGTGRLYLFFKNDMPTGLDYMCKAYNAYVKVNSPYRSDAEKTISYVYGKMKAAGQEDEFYKILAKNNIKPSKE